MRRRNGSRIDRRSGDTRAGWPVPGRRGRYKVENALHTAVCDGRVKLTAAQNAIASNWETAEQVLGIS
jgi:hypothetical protein